MTPSIRDVAERTTTARPRRSREFMTTVDDDAVPTGRDLRGGGEGSPPRENPPSRIRAPTRCLRRPPASANTSVRQRRDQARGTDERRRRVRYAVSSRARADRRSSSSTRLRVNDLRPDVLRQADYLDRLARQHDFVAGTSPLRRAALRVFSTNASALRARPLRRAELLPLRTQVSALQTRAIGRQAMRLSSLCPSEAPARRSRRRGHRANVRRRRGDRRFDATSAARCPSSPFDERTCTSPEEVEWSRTIRMRSGLELWAGAARATTCGSI